MMDLGIIVAFQKEFIELWWILELW
jgi:hypothetical protein